jgi:release factor glutamine methyltransferase
MNLKEALIRATAELKQAKILTAELDSELLLEHVLEKHGFNRVKILAYPETQLNPQDQTHYFNLIHRRAQKEPVAYITKTKEFFGIPFYVDQRVLIPRPETEILVEEALRTIINKAEANKEVRVIDVGCGSGCIAIALQKILQIKYPHFVNRIKIQASDISQDALAVARKNLTNQKLTEKISLYQSDLLSKIRGKFDVICANLPYLSKKDYSAVDQEIKIYEPKKSLKGGDEGVELYLKLFKQIPDYIRPDAELLIEIHPYQKEALVKEAKAKFSRKFKNYALKDLANKERVLLIQF